MKKIFTFLCLLLSVLSGRADVSTTPTTELTTGYYVIRVFSNKTNTEKGNYMYYSGGNALMEPANETSKNFEDRTTALLDNNYLWKVTVNDDNTVTIASCADESKFFPNLDGTPQTLTLGTAGNYTVHKSTLKENCFFFTIGNYCLYSNGTTSDSHIGSWSNTSGTTGETANMMFYKASLDEQVNVTYNYNINGETVAKTYTWGKGCKFPQPTLPAFVTVTTWPEGTVTEATTKSVDATFNAPVKPNTWYFLKCAPGGKGGYLYDQGDATLMRMQANISLANNSYAWKFEGNPFDGFKVVNANGKKLIAKDQLAAGYNGGGASCYASTTVPAGAVDTWMIKAGLDASSITLATAGTPIEFLLSERGGSGDLRLGIWGANQDTKIVTEEALPSIILNPLNGQSYATYYLPFAAKAPENVKVYAGKVEEGSVKLSEYTNGIVPANMGVLLVGNDESVTSATFTLTNETATTLDNDLKGVLTATELTAVENSNQVRVFSKKDGVAGFYALKDGVTSLAANKAYVLAPTATAALVLNFGGTTTAIDQVVKAEADNDNAIYDLAGRRVAKAVKGVYVKNGKKFIVK